MSSLETLYHRFQNAQISRDEWNHAAHLGVALWVCSHHDEETALDILRAGIRRQNEAQGVENGPHSGYHETLTVFFVRVVSAFWQAHREQELETLYPLLLAQWGDKKRIFEFYPRRLLFSPQAREQWIEPLVPDWLNIVLKKNLQNY